MEKEKPIVIIQKFQAKRGIGKNAEEVLIVMIPPKHAKSKEAKYAEEKQQKA